MYKIDRSGGGGGEALGSKNRSIGQTQIQKKFLLLVKI